MWGKIGTYEFVTYKFVIHTALSLDIQYGGQIEDYFLLLLVLPWNITLTIMLSNRLNYENSFLPEQRIGNNHRNSSEVSPSISRISLFSLLELYTDSTNQELLETF
jgi:hypothetical protein